METIEDKIKILFQDAQEQFLTTKPMWLRLNLLANMLSAAKENNVSEKDIKWDKINTMLKQNVSEYDFNMFDDFHNFQSVFDAALNSKTASIIGPWRKYKCKDCGKQFYMSLSEVEFYQDKQLHMPKRCRKCRQKRNNY